MHCRQFFFRTLLKGTLTHPSSHVSLAPIAERLQNSRIFCTSNNEEKKEQPKPKEYCDGVELPEEPTTCCMSGCANCVWIEYAKQLKTIFCCSDEKTQEIILKKVNDPNMRAFLAMELKMMQK